MSNVAILDAHVHFWDPGRIEYPWLEELPTLRRSFLPDDYDSAMAGVPIAGLLFVEANPRSDRAIEEVRFIEGLADADPRIEGIVAFLDLLDLHGRAQTLDVLSARSRVKGIRHNIQGEPPGFALRPEFISGVQEAGRRGYTFDLCATHDQLPDVVALAREAEGCRLILDHCGKPAIRDRAWEPWASQIRELAGLPHVGCKVSGLLTAAKVDSWRGEEIRPYVEHVVDCFGTQRVLYGSDWPVLTLADRSALWYSLTLEWTAGWGADERSLFYGENARRIYGL